MNCPYCASRASDSADHVFPQFLGGRATVFACNQCNSTFGHTLEASAFEHFKNWMLVFRRSGMKPPKPMVWRRVASDDTGRRYDIDQDFKAVPSDPIITRDDEGQIIKVEGSPKQLSKIAQSLHSKGARLSEVKGAEIRLDMRSLTLTYPLDEDLRRLALKMSIACVCRLGQEQRVSDDVRSYLICGLQAESNSVAPVRVALQQYSELDAGRPRLGHLIYVRANSHNGRSYSIVQFFGAIQLYCELGFAMKSDDYAILATHDPVSHHEDFREIAAVDYVVPPQFISREDWKSGLTVRFERVRRELVDLYGDQAPSTLSVDF